MQLREKELQVEGGRLFVEEIGEGPTVLLLHAGVTDRRDLAVPVLASSYRVIRYDMRGYGRSPRATAPFSLVADAVAVLDQFEADTAHVVGLSQGAATAVDLALARPERVRSLALVAPGLSGFDWPQLPGYGERLAAAEQGDTAALAAGIARLWAPMSFGADGKLGDDLAAQMVRDHTDLFLLDELEVEQPSAVDRLKEITVPTVVVLGARDVDAITTIGTLLESSINGARKVVLPDADHILPLRMPDEFHAVLLEHLAS